MNIRIIVLSSVMAGVLGFSLALGQTPANLNLQITNGFPRLSISGATSNNCTLQIATNFGTLNPWHFVTSFPANSSPAFFSDTNSLRASLRLYRVFTQRLPANVTPISNMIWVSPGSFTMGSPTNEAARGSDETQHEVILSSGFYLGKYPVTQGEYQALTGNNPSFFSFLSNNSMRPVDSAQWTDATNFCTLLTQQEQIAGRLPNNWVYRLPTEAEWEYACRAGTLSAFYCGNQLRSGMANFDGEFEYDSVLGTITNFGGINLSQPTIVGSYEPNAWGFSDMCGNLSEWVQDLYASYSSGPVTDPQGALIGTNHVLRGGGWNTPGYGCRSAQRVPYANTSIEVGFRIALAPKP